MRTRLFRLLWLLALSGCAGPRVFQPMDSCWIAQGNTGLTCIDPAGKQYTLSFSQAAEFTCYRNDQFITFDELCHK